MPTYPPPTTARALGSWAAGQLGMLDRGGIMHPRADLRSFDVRDRRQRAGVDNDLPCAQFQLFGTGSDLDASRSGECCLAVDHQHRFQVVEHGEILGAHHGGELVPALDGLLECLLVISGSMPGFGIMDQGLGRHATDIDAGAAMHLGGLLDHRHPLSCPGQSTCQGLAAFAPPDHDHIELFVRAC